MHVTKPENGSCLAKEKVEVARCSFQISNFQIFTINSLLAATTILGICLSLLFSEKGWTCLCHEQQNTRSGIIQMVIFAAICHKFPPLRKQWNFKKSVASSCKTWEFGNQEDLSAVDMSTDVIQDGWQHLKEGSVLFASECLRDNTISRGWNNKSGRGWMLLLSVPQLQRKTRTISFGYSTWDNRSPPAGDRSADPS